MPLVLSVIRRTLFYSAKILTAYTGKRNDHTSDVIDTTGWEIVDDDEYCRQKDTFNCGAYVIWYMQQLMKGESLNSNIDVADFRKLICWYLRGLPRKLNLRYEGDADVPIRVHQSAFPKSGLVADPTYYSHHALRNIKSMPDRQNTYVVAAFAQSSNTVSPYAERIVVSGNDLVSTQGELVQIK
ncbi:hypothetical protein U1Q18_050451 [Sarracenia purpurea var. burkii]